MMPLRFEKTLICILVALCIFPYVSSSLAQSVVKESLLGFYARVGNNSTSSRAAGNNIYIKFFEDRWIAMLYVPYPYASGVKPSVINGVFDTAREQISSSSYVRGTFDHLTERATLHFERYGYLDDRIVFECGSLAPCTIAIGDDYLELIKPGVINEHIIKYNHFLIE